MSRKQDKGEVEVGMMNGAWDWFAEVEGSYKLLTRVIIVPTVEKYRWSVRAVAEVVGGDGTVKTVAQITQRWPTSGTQTLSGLILAMSLSIERMAGEWALTSRAQEGSAPQEG